ncbi:MAG: heavy metal transporter [Saprospiraceae bacterium]|nr:heavy-metal-associated domain-containing protein [Bacteroidia bacterium]MBT8228868.1 heavy-metal-associated domain-containing protein [Bacteroidia bacterium]NNF21489.1 heavy metal transporter [Saprospiraceae bacterium]NNK90259.1 heavy metal transporter [Saprospiraceae bacterium]
MTYRIQVDNIKCGGCENSIKSRLNSEFGFDNINIDRETGLIELEKSEDFNQEHVSTTLYKMGYPKIGEGNVLVTAKSFVSCMIGRMKETE